VVAEIETAHDAEALGENGETTATTPSPESPAVPTLPPPPTGPQLGDKVGFIQLPVKSAPRAPDKTGPVKLPPGRPGMGTGASRPDLGRGRSDVGRGGFSPSHGRQQLAHGTVVGYRIADGEDGLESVEPCRIGSKTRPQVPFGLVLVLDVVQLIGRGLPNFDQRTGNRRESVTRPVGGYTRSGKPFRGPLRASRVYRGRI